MVIASVYFESWYIFGILVLLWCIYTVTLGCKREFARNAKATTCPRCNKSFSYEQYSTSGKELNREYKTKEVQEGFGKNAYKRRGVFAYGIQEVHYSAKCLNCQYSAKWTNTKTYEREV